jgi:outer membrane protein TolC
MRRATLHATVLATFCLAAAAAHASQAPLPLLAALDSAAAHFPATAAARAAADAARASIGEAYSEWYPTVRLAGSATQYEEPMLVTPLHGLVPGLLPPFDTTVWQGNLSARWTLLDGGGRSARVQTARGRADAAGSSLTATEHDLAARVVQAYLRVLTESQVLRAQDQRLDALAAERARAERLLAAGRAPRVQVLRAEAARAAAAAERVRIATALEVAERDLARLVGLEVETARSRQLVPIALADTSLPDRAGSLAEARHRSPALARARAELAVAHAGAALAQSARWPELRLAGNYNGWADDAGHDALEWNAAAEVTWPLFTGGRTARGIERARAQERAAAEAVRLADVQLAEDIDRALSRVVQARARVHSLTVAVDRFAEVARIEKLSLDAGSGTQTDYLRAEADLLEVRAALVEARHGEMASRVDLARATGALDRDWIARNLSEDRP